MSGRHPGSYFNARGPVMPKFGKAVRREPVNTATVTTTATVGTSWWLDISREQLDATSKDARRNWGAFGSITSPAYAPDVDTQPRRTSSRRPL